jgi:two-component system OmpR family sensor kinase
MSLRARLVLVVFVLLAAGLIASNLASATALRAYMLGQVDERLDSAAAFSGRFVLDDRFPPPTNTDPPPGVRAANGIAEIQAALLGTKGELLRTFQGPFSSTSEAFDHLPSDQVQRALAGETVRFDMSTAAGDYRVLAQPMSGTDGAVVLISPLAEVQASVTRLYWIGGIATAVLLLVAGASALWLVRIGLRPLSHITDTADAVAAGDAERRVDVSGGHEVAKLGRALNSAFDARTASEQALREFISDASHELRTPLTSIRGYAELLRAGALETPADRDRAIQRIEHEAARMGVLVDDLLALARLDEGRPLEFSPVDLTKVASDAVNDARAVEPDRPISLAAPQPVHVVGDETSLRQIFANLLSNARHHTEPRVPVEVRVAPTSNGARIDVLDDGLGLDDEDRAHAFDRFWRAQRTRGHGGSGLGLAIVAALATAHGGDARAVAGEEHLRGAHFVVTVPAQPPAALGIHK